MDDPALGLARDRVVVRPYDDRWPQAFAEESARLRALLGPLARALEHVGSTAVPGLPAKPVLDVAIAYAHRSALEAMRDLLARAGYEDRGDQGEQGGVVFVKGPATRRTHHLHLVAEASAQWRRYLASRDALRRDDSLRARYGALKGALARRFPADRVAYTAGKDDFVADVLAKVAPARAGTFPEAGSDM